MSNLERAKQFSPFDALKGLQTALKLKEYEHEKKLKGDLTNEKIEEISLVLSKINKNSIIKLTYYYDGYNYEIQGKCKIDYINQKLIIENRVINFDDIIFIKILKND